MTHKIKIQNSEDVESGFFKERDFGESIKSVSDVIANVKKRGDAALFEYSARFDALSPAPFEIPSSQLKDAAEKLKQKKPDLYDALCFSRDLALRFAKKQRESFVDFEYELEPGLFTGQKNIPVEKAGVYIPAGRFPLVSSVIMTSAPALAAGVKELILCTPPRLHPDDKAEAEKYSLGTQGNPFTGGKPYADENIMAAAHLCGITKAFALGGSQAIAALAFGTESVPRVDVIAGPGNAFVAEAKRQVSGAVGIDMIAGPTEVFIIADESASPFWVAADLLAQAEHDVFAQPVLATTSEDFAQKVALEVERQLEALPTKAIAEQSIQNCGRIIICGTLEQAIGIANRKAPEHLELAIKEGSERDKIVSLARNYGSLFIGHEAAEVFGDYSAGLNHTLPTSGSARFTGGLSVRVFLKTVTTLRVIHKSEGAKKSACAAASIANAEGLAAHAQAAQVRLR